MKIMREAKLYLKMPVSLTIGRAILRDAVIRLRHLLENIMKSNGDKVFFNVFISILSSAKAFRISVEEEEGARNLSSKFSIPLQKFCIATAIRKVMHS